MILKCFRRKKYVYLFLFNFNIYFIELHGSYFPKELDIALTVWNMYVIVGLAWQAGWSTSLCVSTKIYFQIGLLCFSIFCYSEYTLHTKICFLSVSLCVFLQRNGVSNQLTTCHRALLSNFNFWITFQKNNN